MAQVNATIAGRQFRLACEDGQEEHLQALAHDLDQRIIDLRAKFGEIGDTRLTVMAALMVADELSEAAHKIRRLEEEATALQDARVVAADRAKAASDAVVNAFNSAAERIEGITKKLNAVARQRRGDRVTLLMLDAKETEARVRGSFARQTIMTDAGRGDRRRAVGRGRDRAAVLGPDSCSSMNSSTPAPSPQSPTAPAAMRRSP